MLRCASPVVMIQTVIDIGNVNGYVVYHVQTHVLFNVGMLEIANVV